MGDRWNDIWQRQREQQKSFGLEPTNMTPLSKAKLAKDLALGLYEEAAELARTATRFKVHILSDMPVEKVDVANEAADVMKYTIAIAQLHGISADQMVRVFMQKSDVVEHKAAAQRIQLEDETRVIIVDMDGCLADLSVLDELVFQAGSLTEQEQIKAEFRRTGGYLELPPIPGSREGMKRLRAAGYKLVVLTARPYQRYNRLYADTMEWLVKYGIDHDMLLFERDKAEAICEHIYPAKPRYFIEDRAKHALEIADLEIEVLLIDAPENRTLRQNPFIKRVADWNALCEEVLKGAERNQDES